MNPTIVNALSAMAILATPILFAAAGGDIGIKNLLGYTAPPIMVWGPDFHKLGLQ
jgi:hypothetical protein